MADRFGPRLVLTRIVLWWSAFTALTGAVSTLPLLILTRFAFGAGEAGAFPSATASIAAWFPASERARMFGVLSMAMQLGGALSPLLVIPIQMRFGWRASFYAFALVGVVWAVAWFFRYSNSPRERARITQAELREIGTADDSGHRVSWGGAVRSANFWAILLMALTFSYGNYFFVSWLQTYLVHARNFSGRDLLFSALPFVFGACANVAGGITSDAIFKRKGLKAARRWVGISGLGCGAVFALLAVVLKARYVAAAFPEFRRDLLRSVSQLSDLCRRCAEVAGSNGWRLEHRRVRGRLSVGLRIRLCRESLWQLRPTADHNGTRAWNRRPVVAQDRSDTAVGVRDNIRAVAANEDGNSSPDGSAVTCPMATL